MKKIQGVRTIDFRITAEGHGVVNWLGSVATQGPDGKEVSNHSIPKIRGFTNKNGKIKEEGSYEYKKTPQEITVNDKNPVYVSRECVRHNLFKDESFNISTVNDAKDARKLISSIVGLLKGYVITDGPVNKKSPVLMESLTEILHNANYEQFSKFGSKSQETSLFSKTTLGDTKYVGYGSLVIEDLFFPLDDIFGRKCMIVPSEDEGQEIAQELTFFLKKLDFEDKKEPKATYNKCYVRVGTIASTGEAGLVLNDDAIDIVSDYLIEKLANLTIRQGGGHLSVTELLVDYNDSNKHLRIKKDPLSGKSKRSSLYAVYYSEGSQSQVLASEEERERLSGNAKAKKESKTKK